MDEDGGQFDDAIILMDGGSEPMSQCSVHAMDIASDVAMEGAIVPSNMNTLTLLEDQKRAYIWAGIELLEAQQHQHVHNASPISITAVTSLSQHTPVRSTGNAPIYPPILTPTMEHSVLQSLCNIVKSP
eukprot:scaffold131736_cov62-Attheya_sp.AAC.2